MATTTPKERRELIALADKAFTQLHTLNNLAWTNYRDRLYAMACEEERGHRRGAPVGWVHPRGATVAAAGKLFAVKRIAQELLRERPATIADVLSFQPSAIYAASLVANYRDVCAAALKDFDLKQLATLDYCKLVGSE